jgi:two-component system sensor histidine kinase SenX3
MVLPATDSPASFTDGLVNYGLIRDGRIQSEDLLALIRVVRRTQTVQEKVFEFSRGPLGEATRLLKVIASGVDAEGTVLVLINDESEAERVANVRRDFVTNVSHELKTPISAMGLLADSIIASKEDPTMVEKWATKMQSESLRLNQLVQEIINLSRLQDSDPMPQAVEFDIVDAVHEAISQCATSADARNIWLQEGETTSAKILGDNKQIVVAIHNLIENAINYSSEKTKVTISTRLVDDVVEVSVVDQGLGIADKEIERIFERFYRVDPARSRETGGTGLGLSIVKHIVANHGGEIKVWSVQDVGSTFVIRIPHFRSDKENE